jgi:predicted hydrolase (HD superfamily)
MNSQPGRNKKVTREEAFESVKAETHNILPETKLDKALFCVDPLTGLIIAATLVRPDKKLAGLKARSVEKRFKEKSFAADADRGHIAGCCEIGVELGEFIALGVEAMKGISDDLGL